MNESKTEWHCYHAPLLPRRDINGDWLGNGQVWRRWEGERWEYRQDDETDKEFYDRAY